MTTNELKTIKMKFFEPRYAAVVSLRRGLQSSGNEFDSTHTTQTSKEAQSRNNFDEAKSGTGSSRRQASPCNKRINGS